MSRTTVEPILRVERLSVAYDGQLAINDLTLVASDGMTTALVGPSGCGKTSLLRAIAGFERPVSGRVLLDGREVSGPANWLPPERRRVGMVFQEGALFPHLTVADNVRFGVIRRPDGARIAEVALDRVGLGALASRYPDQLSGGQRQLVALARALAPSPPIVLLDEPFASLDAPLRARLRHEVREILTGSGITALFVTHDQEEALSVSDRVAVMMGGRLLQTGSPEQIYEQPASAEVARFVGGGELFACQVRGGTVATPFGELIADAADGPARLLIRPEQTRIGRDGVAGEVVECRFHGHATDLDVRLSSGDRIRVRVVGGERMPRGAAVRLELRRRRLRLFPSRGDATWARRSANDPGRG